MTPYKFGDIEITVSCKMERDEEMEAALQYMMAAKERLETTKQVLNPRIDAVGEARLAVILEQLRGLVKIMKCAGIKQSISAYVGYDSSVRLDADGLLGWRIAYMSDYAVVSVYSKLDDLKNDRFFQDGIRPDGILSLWDERNVYEQLRDSALAQIRGKAKAANDQASTIEDVYHMLTGGAK